MGAVGHFASSRSAAKEKLHINMPTISISSSSSLLVFASLVSGFTLQPTLPSGPRGLTSAQLASSGSVAAPVPHMGATKQYRGATVRAQTEQETLNVPDEEHDEFFHLVDNLLGDSDEGEGRQFRRGWLGMRRPQFLMRRQDGYQRPQTFYRSFVDGCYGLLCELGINGLINSMSRMINNY